MSTALSTLSAAPWCALAAENTEAQHNDFFALSKLLTSNPQISPKTSARIYTALSAQNLEFQQHAAALFQFAQQHQLKNAESIVSALNFDQAPLQNALHQIVDAWYLGVVGVGTHSKVIAYESALMFDRMRDVISVPSYCHAPPGYWTTQPLKTKG